MGDYFLISEKNKARKVGLKINHTPKTFTFSVFFLNTISGPRTRRLLLQATKPLRQEEYRSVKWEWKSGEYL